MNITATFHQTCISSSQAEIGSLLKMFGNGEHMQDIQLASFSILLLISSLLFTFMVCIGMANQHVSISLEEYLSNHNQYILDFWFNFSFIFLVDIPAKPTQ